MRFEWDLDVDALYVRVVDQAVAKQRGTAPLIADLSGSGEVVGVEVLFPVPLDVVGRFLDELGLPADLREGIGMALNEGNLHALAKRRGGEPATRGDERSRTELVSTTC